MSLHDDAVTVAKGIMADFKEPEILKSDATMVALFFELNRRLAHLYHYHADALKEHEQGIWRVLVFAKGARIEELYNEIVERMKSENRKK